MATARLIANRIEISRPTIVLTRFEGHHRSPSSRQMWKTRRRHLLTMGAPPPPHIIINQVKLSVLLPRSLVDRFPTILYEDLVKTSQRTNNAVSHAWQGFAPLPPVRFDLYLGGPLVGCRRDFEIACIVSRALWDTRFPFSIRPGD